MMTLSLEPGAHPQRRAALAAHKLREALAAGGLLQDVPECRAVVVGDDGFVALGKVSAATAMRLAAIVSRGARRRAR
jgi:hypothetical protein